MLINSTEEKEKTGGNIGSYSWNLINPQEMKWQGLLLDSLSKLFILFHLVRAPAYNPCNKRTLWCIVGLCASEKECLYTSNQPNPRTWPWRSGGHWRRGVPGSSAGDGSSWCPSTRRKPSRSSTTPCGTCAWRLGSICTDTSSTRLHNTVSLYENIISSK